MPPLVILKQLAKGDLPTDSETVIAMADNLKKYLSHLLHEHKAIIVELHNLMEAAQIGKKDEYVHLAERLILHAQIEEEVLYPAAVMIGDYIKLKARQREG